MTLASLVPFQGPKKSQFSGPTPSNAQSNDVAPLKTITYHAIKITGTLIVIINCRAKTPTPYREIHISYHKQAVKFFKAG